jgi:hypothetical protein
MVSCEEHHTVYVYQSYNKDLNQIIKSARPNAFASVFNRGAPKCSKVAMIPTSSLARAQNSPNASSYRVITTRTSQHSANPTLLHISTNGFLRLKDSQNCWLGCT